MASITAISVAHLARAVAAVGGEVAAVVGDARRDARYQDRIPLATLVDMWERAIAHTGRRDLPAVAAAYGEPDTRSLITFVVANQPRLGAGIDVFDRYGPTVSDAYRWTMVDDHEAGMLRVVLSQAGPIHRLGWQCYVEFEALDIARSLDRLTETTTPPRALRFLHAPPPADVVAAYTAALGVTPAFAAPCCELVYPLAVRALPVPRAKPALAAAIATQLDAMLDAIERGTPVSARVRGAIGGLLERGGSVDALARALAMSRRSLERALADEGTSAAALIEDERKQRALAWLPALTVDEVAARLGYSDARAFARAFKRWTGQAPSRYRASVERR